MVRKIILSAGLIAAAGMLAGAGASNASVQTFSGFFPATGADASTIAFTFDSTNNQIQVNIQNTSGAVSSIGQAISGISFALSGFNGSLSVDPDALVGYEGDSTPENTLLSNSELHNPWQVAGTGGTFALGNPKIIPGLSAGKGYPTAAPTDLVVETISSPNGSIMAHDPSLFGTGTNGADGVTFTLDAPSGSITASTAVAGNITVYFGTGPDSFAYDHLLGTPTPVPAGGELPTPATLPLVGGGLLGLGILALRKRRRLSQRR